MNFIEIATDSEMHDVFVDCPIEYCGINNEIITLTGNYRIHNETNKIEIEVEITRLKYKNISFWRYLYNIFIFEDWPIIEVTSKAYLGESRFRFEIKESKSFTYFSCQKK